MTVKQARIAFIDAREAFAIASLNVRKAENRLDVLKRKGASPALVEFASQDVAAANNRKFDAHLVFQAAKRELQIAEAFHAIDEVHAVNEWGAKISARFDRFMTNL